jgi:hypothetical protein
LLSRFASSLAKLTSLYHPSASPVRQTDDSDALFGGADLGELPLAALASETKEVAVVLEQ